MDWMLRMNKRLGEAQKLTKNKLNADLNLKQPSLKVIRIAFKKITSLILVFYEF